MRVALVVGALGLWIASLVGVSQLQVTREATYALAPKFGDYAERYETYLSFFPRDYGAVVSLELDPLCTEEGWALLAALHSELASLPLIERVESLVSATYIRDESDTLHVGDFGDYPFADAAARCSAALQFRPYQQILISADQANTAVFATATMAAQDLELTEQIRPLVQRYHEDMAAIGGSVVVAGEPLGASELVRLTENSTRLIGFLAITMMILVWAQTKRLLVGLLTGLLGIFAISITWGLMGAIGWVRSPINSLAISLLVPLSAAFVLHAHAYCERGSLSWHLVFPQGSLKAFLFATATTSVGFLATAISRSPEVRTLGLVGAVGVVALLVGTLMIVFPALNRPNVAVRMEAEEENELKVSGTELAVFCALVVGLAIGLFFTKVNYEPIDYVLPDNPVAVEYHQVGDDFGNYGVPILIDTQSSDGALDPVLWRDLRMLEASIEQSLPGSAVGWLYEPVQEAYLGIVGEERTPNAFPDTAIQLEQLLLFFENDALETRIDDDRRYLVMYVHAKVHGSVDFLAFVDVVDQFFATKDIEGYVAGRANNLFSIGHEIGARNVINVGVAVFLVWCCLLLLLRSFRLAAIGTAINAVPIVVCFGMMAVLAIPLDLGSSIVAAVALGIVVDDTSHFLVRYEALKSGGLSAKQAAVQAKQRVRNPIMTTTIAVVVGLLWFFTAEFTPFHAFGVLLGASLLTALYCDLRVLPLLLAKIDHPR